MSGLTPEERDEVIDQIHGLAESLREGPTGIEIRGCTEAAGPLLVIGALVFTGYIVFSLDGLARTVIIGIILGIAAVSLILYFVYRATR